MKQNQARLTGRDTPAFRERDICTKFVMPSLVANGWDFDTQIRDEIDFTDGRIYVREKIRARGSQKRVDPILCYKPNSA